MTYGTISQAPIWRIWDRFDLPDLWPALFLFVGLTAAAGIFKPWLARVALYWGAGLMLLWAFASAAVWYETGVPTPVSILVLVMLAWLKVDAAECRTGGPEEREATSRVIHEAERIKNV